MTIKIVKSNESIPVTNISMLIYGESGVGKTTLAFTSNKALILDFDNGVKHIAMRNGNDIIQIKKWQDVEDLTLDVLAPYDTIIVDTIGKMSDTLKPYVLNKFPTYGKNGTPNQKGWGELKQQITSWKNMLMKSGKDIIILAHVVEEKDGDNIKKRFKMEGSTKDDIRADVDMIGYMCTDGDKRIIDFNPTDFKIGKNRGKIPSQEVKEDHKTFLADLLEFTKSSMNAKSEEMVQAEFKFDEALNLICLAEIADDFNKLLTHKLIAGKAGNKILKTKLIDEAKVNGLAYHVESKCFSPIVSIPESVAPPANETPEVAV
jgi:phage nucleotide-binding protein